MHQPSAFAMGIHTSLSFEAAESRLRQLLADHGFGIMTEIDVAATLKAKLGLESAPCRILGACNPPFAHQAMEVEPAVSTLLPCNVVVRDLGQVREVLAMDPAFMGQVVPQLAALGTQVSHIFRSILQQVERESPGQPQA